MRVARWSDRVGGRESERKQKRETGERERGAKAKANESGRNPETRLQRNTKTIYFVN